MANIEQPSFDAIFASGAGIGELLSWPSDDYLRGWGYLGKAEPPPMEFFNSLQNVSDLKSQYIFKSLNIRKNSTVYTYGDVVLSPNMPQSLQLFCTQSGTTSSVEPSMDNIVEGNTVTDGTVKWLALPRAYRITMATNEQIQSAITEVLG